MLSAEDLALARKQLSEQVERMPDGPQKDSARAQLNGMSDEAISAMVEQQRPAGAKEQKSVFRMIVEGSIPSKKIDENNDAIAVVSIRPVSKGHVIVIPRKLAAEEKDVPEGAHALAKKVATICEKKLKPSKVEIQPLRAFDEVILSVIPIYDKKVDVNSPPYEASEEELNEVYDLLRVVVKKKKEVIRIKKKKEEEVIQLKRRVP